MARSREHTTTPSLSRVAHGDMGDSMFDDRALRVGYTLMQPIPSPETETIQVLASVDALAGADVDVELLVPGRYRTLTQRKRSFDAEIRRIYGLRHGFRIRRIWTVEPSRLHLERPPHALASVLGLGHRYDMIHTRNFIALEAAIARRVPVVFETYKRLGHDAPRQARRLAKLAATPSLLGIIAHSQQAARSLAMAGVPDAKLHVIYNGYDPGMVAPTLARDDARLSLGLDKVRPLAVYAGSLQPKKGVGALLDLAENTPEIAFVFVGGRDRDLAAFTQALTRRALTNVICPGWRSPAELAPYLRAADVLLIPPTGRPLVAHGITVLPMKTFIYMVSARPILAPALPDISEVLVHDDNAWLVAPDDPHAAATGLRTLVADRDLRERLGVRAREDAAGLTWDARARRLATLYRTWLTALGDGHLRPH